MLKKAACILVILITAVMLFGACTDSNENSHSADTNLYSVIIDYNNGAKTDTVTVKAGEMITAPEHGQKQDHEFLGWLDGTAEVSFPYEVTKDVTLKASWRYVDPHFYTQPQAAMTVEQGEKNGPSCEVKLKKGHFFTYQWYVNEKADTGGAKQVEGATDRALVIPDNTPVGQHYYFCRVTVCSFGSGEPTESFDSDFTCVTVKKGSTNILVVGSGTVRQDKKHDSVEFLSSLLKAGGYDMVIDTIVKGSNYNIWESGLTGENQADIRQKLNAKKYSYIILQSGRDYAVCTEATRDKEIAAYKNILSMAEALAPGCEIILIEGPWRQDMTTKYYVDRFIPAGIDSNDKHKEAIKKLFEEHLLPIKDDVKLNDMITAFQMAQQADIDPYGSKTNDFPGLNGSYLLACMSYANITGKSPEGLDVVSCSLGSIKTADGAALQKIAAQVVLGN